LQILALAIFVAIGGHRLMMMSILDSFRALPAADTTLPGGMLETMTRLVSESFRMAVRVAAPAVTAVLAATLLIGLASRAMPQLNSFTMGFTVNLWVTFLALLFSLAVIGHLFSDEVTSFMSIWQQTF
jgi:flagellar biosynthetic protein FliR